MNAPTQYEHFVAEYFKAKGYTVKVTPVSNDYGIDVILTKGAEKIAVQAKMYGGTSRKVNRKCLMELHGAKSLFDCSKAIIVTDGDIQDDAKEVAYKLDIDIVYLPFAPSIAKKEPSDINEERIPVGQFSFDSIWSEYVLPLKGKTIIGETGLANKIVKADFSGVTRITKNGKSNTIPIEPFKWAINRILTKGSVTRDEINQEFVGRLSSGTILILSQIPIFTALTNPLRIVKK